MAGKNMNRFRPVCTSHDRGFGSNQKHTQAFREAIRKDAIGLHLKQFISPKNDLPIIASLLDANQGRPRSAMSILVSTDISQLLA
jgi:hypothetical protein